LDFYSEKAAAMDTAENKKQIDRDIRKFKADSLRMEDIIPPFGKGKSKGEGSEKKVRRKDDSAQVVTEEERAALADTKAIRIESRGSTPLPVDEAEEPAGDVKGPSEEEKREAEIPRFDLGKELMAEQRKVTAGRRRRPGEKAAAEAEKKAEPVRDTAKERDLEEAEEDRIIAEIVARDIERLYRGGSS
jgi:hypothetical protein